MKILAIFAICVLASAHGGDKPGPHGGFITMPAAFHVEVVPEGARKFKVYLLDAHFKNPMATNSSVTASVGKSVAKCAAQTDHFACELTDADLTKKGSLTIDAVRDKQKGNSAKYELPLKR